MKKIIIGMLTLGIMGAYWDVAANPNLFSEVLTSAGCGKPGSQDARGQDALLNRPHGITQANSGMVYFADRGNHQIRAFDPKTSVIRTVAGSGKAEFVDGQGNNAGFNQPIGITVDSNGMIYVADRENHRVRKIDSNGDVITIAGTGVAGFVDGALEAQFNQPYGVALNTTEEELLITDYLNHSIRKLDLKTGVVSTLAGNGVAGNIDGKRDQARFNQPYSIKRDPQGNFLIPDQLNHSIRRLTPEGVVTTIAGNGKPGFADGEGLAAQFNNPTGVAVDSEGRIYVADRNNHRIRFISPDGSVGTLAGTGTEGDHDGSLAESEFRRPLDLVYDSALKTLIVSEENGHRIRTIR
ncbi:MAG: SMP-30/gluconolactonase/LRE family protein [Deltaproteobacteria bacterium]|nr:SMP-30/gluconolactonase/LRE family protein [Deltaproteobacteria bacterium]